MSSDIEMLIAEVDRVLAHPLQNRDWRGIVRQLRDALKAEHQRAERASRGARTLGEIVERNVEDMLRWAGMEDQIGTEDPDQQLAWELCAEMPGKIASLQAERDALRNAIQDLIEALDYARAHGEVFTYGMVQDRLSRAIDTKEKP